MTSSTPAFEPGTKVQYRSDRAKVGEVVRSPTSVQDVYWYSVQLLNGAIETVPEQDLQGFRAAQDPRGLFVEGRFGGTEDLVRKVTFHKLDEPLQNTLYSLGASRTEFYAHQYKPLLKFVDSDNHRLLIADEVGLGKTIEAGLILVELRARRELNQALVVCPSALVHKWRHELWNRFEEEFQVFSSRDFRNLLSQFQERAELGELRGIISLQSLRQRGNRELIEATPLPLDLLIVDEAHHLRNPSTLSHRTVDALAVGASAMVFLTATPIHLGSENLFYLLKILSPGEYPDVESFDNQLKANEPIVECERLVRRSPLPREEVAERLKAVGGGPYASYFKDNAFYRRSVELVETTEPASREVQVSLEAQLKDLNLFSHIITRSRKRDVFENTAVRTPIVVAREPTREELDFYDTVTEFVREGQASDVGAYFAAMTAQRQVASSIQAAKDQFRARAVVALGDPELSDLNTVNWDEMAEADEDATWSLPERVILAADRLGQVDTKLDALFEQIRALEAEEPGRKILIFSYFKPTLRYLEQRISQRGIRCVRIDGDVRTDLSDPSKDDRGRVMRAFKEDPQIQVLLSSEVGSEGLDFQFCHVLVNYDLPWNPMRIEQRIGRLDRLGQQSDRIIIVNLSLVGTIEHRILHRLYERIGIFRASIGDLEAILGDEIEKLTRDLLSRHLTPEEEEERIERTASVLERRKLELDRLERDGDRFLGRDVYFDEQLERARSGGEVVAPRDLSAFLTQYIEREHPDSDLRRMGDGPLWTLSVGRMLEDRLRSMYDPRPIRLRLLQRIVNGGGRIRSTFDSGKALEDPELEFLAPHHPILLLAVEHYQGRSEELHPTTSVAISADGELPPGEYIYLLFQVTITAGRERHRLVPFLVSTMTGEPVGRHLTSITFGRMLRDGLDWDIESWNGEAAEELLESLELKFLEYMARERVDIIARQQARTKTRLVSLESSFSKKVERKKELLNEARSEGKPHHYLRLLEGTIRSLEADFGQRRSELEAESEVRMSHALVANGVLKVGGYGHG